MKQTEGRTIEMNGKEICHDIDVYNKNDRYELDNSIMAHYYPHRIMEIVDNRHLNCLGLGIGNGYATEIFSQFFKQHIVLEGDKAIIDRFEKEFPDIEIKIIETYFEDWETEEKFDVIVMGCILEHVDNPNMILRKYKQFLSPGGRIFITVPNAEALNRRVGKSAGLLKDLYQLSEHDIKLGHKRYYTLASLEKEVEEAGLTLVRKEGIFLKAITTAQIQKLNFSREIINGFLEVGRDYPELCLALLAETVVNV